MPQDIDVGPPVISSQTLASSMNPSVPLRMPPHYALQLSPTSHRDKHLASLWPPKSTTATSPGSLVCDLNRTPTCYGKTRRLLCPFFRNLHLRENLARDCFTSTASTVTNSVQNISLPIYVIVTNTRLQPLTTTFYNSMLVSFSLLKI